MFQLKCSEQLHKDTAEYLPAIVARNYQGIACKLNVIARKYLQWHASKNLIK